MNIMLVDDEKEILVSLGRTMELMGHSADCFMKAEEAVTAYSAKTYDFVFVDFLMPDTDGIWFMKHIKASPRTRILLLTAFVNREVINEMMHLGASG